VQYVWSNKDVYWVNVRDVTEDCICTLKLVSLVNADGNKAPGQLRLILIIGHRHSSPVYAANSIGKQHFGRLSVRTFVSILHVNESEQRESRYVCVAYGQSRSNTFLHADTEVMKAELYTKDRAPSVPYLSSL
jgi:hypothetical protein